MKHWLAFALDRDILVTAIKVALIVGTLLVVINYADRIVTDSLTAPDYWKILLTYTVPYFVSTYSAVKTKLGADEN